MSRILVVGSQGFIGSALIESLQLRNLEIYTIDVKDSNEPKHYKLDITNFDLVKKVVSKIQPEIVVHLAAQIDVRESFLDPVKDLEVNGRGLLNVLTQSILSGCKNFCFIHSGGAIYDSKGKLPILENGSELPVSPYGLTKSLGEGYVRVLCEKARINWSSLALSNCFGPVHEHGRGVIYQFANSLMNGEGVTINGSETTRDFIYIEDVTAAIRLAIDNPTNCRVNISSGVETNLIDLYSMISGILEIRTSPKIVEATFGEITRSALSNLRAKELLGWAPVNDFKTGLSKALGK